MRGFLRSLAGEGRAVLVSSHLMSELQDTADHLVVVGRGKVIADTSVAELIAAASGDRVMLRTTARAEAMTVLASAGATVAVDRPRHAHRVRAGGRAHRRAARRATGVPFSEVSAHRATLEEAYMELTRDAVEFRAAAAGAQPGPVEERLTERADEHRDHHALPVRAAAGPGRLRAAAAGGVDQVPHRARLADRRDRRRGPDAPLGLVGPGGPGRQREAGVPAGDPTNRRRPGRRGGHRQLLLRAPAAGRQRQHHRPGDVAERLAAARQAAARRECSPQGPQPWAKAGIIIKASTRPGSAYAAVMVTGRPRRAHAVRTTPATSPGCPARVRGVAAVAAADPLRRHDHRLRLGRRQPLDRDRHGHPGRTAAHRAGGAVRRLAAVCSASQSFARQQRRRPRHAGGWRLRPRQPVRRAARRPRGARAGGRPVSRGRPQAPGGPGCRSSLRAVSASGSTGAGGRPGQVRRHVQGARLRR